MEMYIQYTVYYAKLLCNFMLANWCSFAIGLLVLLLPFFRINVFGFIYRSLLKMYRTFAVASISMGLHASVCLFHSSSKVVQTADVHCDLLSCVQMFLM